VVTSSGELMNQVNALARVHSELTNKVRTQEKELQWHRETVRLAREVFLKQGTPEWFDLRDALIRRLGE
jgi:hypothetical protein